MAENVAFGRKLEFMVDFLYHYKRQNTAFRLRRMVSHGNNDVKMA
jgi:hypothetical protein